MAFSTASAPELNNTERFSPEPGVLRLSSSATAMYSSYGVTMKQVCVKSATCSRTASTTRGDELPIVVTAMPEPRSIRRLPSTSSTMPPPARATNTGKETFTPPDTAAARRLLSSSDAGPGISVTSWRVCSRLATTSSSPRRAGHVADKDYLVGRESAGPIGHQRITRRHRRSVATCGDGRLAGKRCAVPGSTRHRPPEITEYERQACD